MPAHDDHAERLARLYTLRGCWRVHLANGKAFYMICEPCSRRQALAAARVKWPDATVD